MILQSLNDLYTRLAEDPAYEIAPPGFSPQKIAFRIRIRPDGSLVQIEDARTPDEKGKLQNNVMLVPGEAKPPGAGINPGLLWDNQTYLLGRQPEDKPDGFGLKRFEAFRQRHADLAVKINDPNFTAVCQFLTQWTPDQLANHPILNEVGTGFGIFAIQGEKRAVHENKRVQAWWLASQSEGEDGPTINAQCLISGEDGPIARLHPKIKSVTGSQAAGASLVSFNANAYESYGKTQSFNAPVGESAAFQYGTALNSLLAGPQSAKHRIRIGDTTTVFWTEKKTDLEDCLAEFLGSGSQAAEEVQDITKREQIKRLLEAVRSGGNYQELSESKTPFYILGLAPNAARVSIRFFHCSTDTDLIRKLHAHQQCMEMVKEFTEQKGNRFPDPEFPAIWQILRETARVADEIPPLLSGALTRAIVEGTPYPEGLFTAIIRRIHADRAINYLRAAILKAVLTRNHNQTITTMLDTENTDPAYLLGRLFASLEQAQRQAHEFKLDRTIRESFFSSASSTPASIFPRIQKLHIHHLRKLSHGSKKFYEDLIGEILSKIGPDKLGKINYPKTLSLISQGTFAIGYYHQLLPLKAGKIKPSETENDPTTV
jgi:CRISPR-associated protein Csd1